MIVKSDHLLFYLIYLICLDDNRVKAEAAGGIEAVVRAIGTHINNAGVCECGCGVLFVITVNGKTNDNINKMK